MEGRSVLGEQHPDVAVSFNKLVLRYQKHKDVNAEAELLCERALLIREQQLSSNHPDIAISLNNLAYLYQLQENYRNAEPPYTHSTAILLNSLGKDHPTTEIVCQIFCGFLGAVIQSGQTEQLLDHPLTQKLLRQIHEENGNARN